MGMTPKGWVLDGIFFALRTGCQWNRMPRELGDDSSNHRWLQRFATDGVFAELWAILVAACDELAGAEAPELVERLRAQPRVPLAPYYDGPAHTRDR